MAFLSALLLVLAFLVGSLPLGHWLLRRLGVDPRVNSAYNLGVENVLRRVGPGPAAASAGLDAAKGFLAVLMASAVGSPEVCVLAGLAAYLGHLNPPRFLYGEMPPRGRGNLVLVGVLAGLSVSGLSLWLTVPPVVVYAAALGFWGYASGATLLGLLAFAALVAVSPLDAAAAGGPR